MPVDRRISTNITKSMEPSATDDLCLEWWNQFGDEFLDQMNESLSNVSTEVPADNYLQHIMNDYCLLELFSVESLDIMDLCSVAETCTRFRQITQRIAPKRICITKGYTEEYKIESRRQTCICIKNDVKRIFTHFGSRLSEVKIEGNYYNYDQNKYFLLHLVARHCDENLKSLTIYELTIPDVFTVLLIPIFRRLHTLHLKNVTLLGEVALFAELNSLVELQIKMGTDCGSILDNIFPKLERFDYRIGIPPKTLSTFISNHKNLKALKLIISCDCAENILAAIGNSCLKLAELSVKIGPVEQRWTTSDLFRPLQVLTSLRTLSLWGVKFEDYRLFESFAELRELTLFRCHLPHKAWQFSSLTRLKKLIIHQHIDSIDKLVTAGILMPPNLEELHIFGHQTVLDRSTFSEIVRIVNGRPHVLTLICERNFNIENCDENRKVRLLSHPRELYFNQ